MRRCFGDVTPSTTVSRYRMGFPVPDERALFELLSLEAFQAGLSWRTILAKRDAFRRALAISTLMPLRALTRQTSNASWRTSASCAIGRRSRPQLAMRAPCCSCASPASRLSQSSGRIRGITAQATSGMERRPLNDTRGRSPRARAQNPRLSLPRPHNALRTHAGLRRGRRPPRRLPGTTRRRARTPSRRADLMVARGRIDDTTPVANTLAVIAHSPGDYERLGLSPTSIEPWEDGARTDDSPGTYECGTSTRISLTAPSWSSRS